jgi:ABC-2 type transport system ATP-binding protein
MKMEKTKALEIKNLHYSYKSDWTSAKFQALKGLSLDVFEGESFGFLGHNGAGKTTTIKCLLGLILPRQGELKIFGKAVGDRNARTSVGYLPEQPYFYDHLTVQEIMEMYATLADCPPTEIKAAVARALERVKVSARNKSPMRALSKGLTQRVAMAQAIVADPKLLVLDEPFSGLDPIGRREFKDLLIELKKLGTTIFMSSHILSDVEFLCDRASIMAHGELKGVFDLANISQVTGEHYELTAHASAPVIEQLKSFAKEIEIGLRTVRCTFVDKKTAEQGLKLALEGGAQIESYQAVRGSLEDLFVKLVKFEEAHTK